MLRVPMKHCLIFLIFCFLSTNSQAIVIRHDVADSHYQANINDFPPLATFYIDGAHGTLIKPNWIVTAAHASFCINENAYVMVSGKARAIKQLYVHPDYTPGKSHDIALVELKKPVLNIAPATFYKQQNEVGKQVWFIGIGGTGTGLTGETIDNAQNNGVLRKAQNTINYANGPLIKFNFDKGQAALPLEGVSGGGDSGGPAFIKTASGFQLLGISSRPEGTFSKIGEYGIIEVYSRVSFFQSWFSKIIDGDKETQLAASRQKLMYLPAGLTEQMLPSICSQIGVKPQ